MAAAGKSSSSTSLEHTPTWAVATVCLIILTLSIFIEHSFHLLTNMLKRRRKTALYDAVDRIKSELMLLGFMSLLLAVTQDSISNICVSRNIADSMLPCALKEANPKLSTKENYERIGRRNLLSMDDRDGLILHKGDFRTPHRSLLADDEDVVDQSVDDIDSCGAKGKVGLITPNGVHQLQIFVIVLAVMQTVNSVLTVALGKAKMWHWKAWEKETQTIDYLIENDPNRFSFTRQTLFGRRHETFTETSVLYLWLKCFYRQFIHSVAKVDYHTIRCSFIAAHMSSKGKNFNFHKYIVTSLEEDFKVVVSIRPYMWCMVVTFLLVDVHGWHAYYLWVSLVPFLMVLLLGTKLETIVARMALRLKNQNSVILGIPVVQPNDDLFWFQQPSFVLALLHLTLFLNAFQLAFFIWVTMQFGLDSCYHEHTLITLARIGLAVVVQVLCSYFTLPLYALVTQMGSQYKNKVLEEQLAKMLKQWHAEVRAKRRNLQLEQSLRSSSTSLYVDLSFRDISNLPRDLSSHDVIPTSTSIESNQVSKRENIIEEEEEIVEEIASSSRVPTSATI